MKHSALFHHHERSGAAFVEQHGWQLVDSFSAPEEEAASVRGGVGIADISYRTKFEMKSQPEHSWWRLSAGRYLVIGEPPLETPAGATDVTSVYANLLLAGPRSRDLLRKMSSLDVSGEALPNLSCAQTTVAHAHAILLREDLGQIAAFHLLAQRDYVESIWESLMHAGEEFPLRPFGLKALESLRG
jgi:heterotetrameric sarcosine oxidase gamma subunit